MKNIINNFDSLKSLTFVFCVFFITSCNVDKDSNKNANKEAEPTINLAPSFQLISNNVTGIDFVNQLKNQSLPPHTQYVNIFNGAGVAVGDINNDGLDDLYFTGNRVGNKLYLNKGNFQFEDITNFAGVAASESWSNGAIFTDVNNDGYEDIYVSCALYLKPNKRENKLFINQGDNTFVEDAFTYGINDQGFSIQSGFFDYDNDGDNDLFVANHPLSRKITVAQHMKHWKNPPEKYSDRLYRNNGDGSFTDITKEAGLLNYGWSLSFITSDFNNDSFQDIYIAVDHGEPDRLFISNGDGTFTDQSQTYFKHISMSSMGSDLSDINNDGQLDLFSAEMLSSNNFREKTQMASMDPKGFEARLDSGYHYQYMRNMLHMRSSDNGFSEIGQMAGIHKSDWSWSSLFFDFDNDSYEDLYIANGYYFDVLDKDFRKGYAKLLNKAKTPQQEAQIMQKIYQNAPSTPTKNRLYKNQGDLTFEEKGVNEGMDFASFSSGAMYADLDNDGKLDIITNNIDQPPFLFRNISSSTNHFIKFDLKGYLNEDPVGTKISFTLPDGSMKTKEYIRARGYASGSSKVLHFGIGNHTTISNIEITWPNGQQQKVTESKIDDINQITYQPIQYAGHSKSSTPFTEVKHQLVDHQENDFDDYAEQVLLPHKMSKLGPFGAKGDINGDGLEDIYIGGSQGLSGQIYIQDSNGSFRLKKQQDISKDKIYEDAGSVFLDSDGDGDLDLYVSSGGYEYPPNHSFYQDRLYINNNGNFKKAPNKLPNLRISSGRVSTGDFDGDGDEDIFVAGRQRPHHYPHPTSSAILVNDGTGIFTNETNTICPELNNIGMITSGKWVDMNNDGSDDLVIAGEWTSVKVFINENGKLKNRTEELGLDKFVGWWNTIEVKDIDLDGDMDIIGGNLGLNYKYQASHDAPFNIFSQDYDTSGTTDIVLGFFEDDVLYPVRGKQCSSEQLPELNEKFDNYNDFASASLIDIYGDELEEGLSYKATEFRSGVFINDQSTFSFLPFHNQAQIAPTNGLVIEDFNDDDILDIVISGNLYGSEVETGRADAGTGTLLLGSGDGTFKSTSYFQSGLLADGDVKDILHIKQAQKELLVFLRNNDAHKIFEVNRTTTLNL